MQQLFDLKNGPLRARITNLGATLIGLWHERSANSFVIGFRDLDDYQRHPIYAGAVVGPVANRIRNGQVLVDGRVWQMPRNEAGRTALHSGPQGLHARLWEPVAVTETALTLRARLPHGACGLPGDRIVELTYKLTPFSLQLELNARTNRRTVMNLAHHPYWVVDAHSRLQVAASHYLPINANTLPTGQIAPVENTPFDLREPKQIPEELDHNYVLAAETRSAPEFAAHLSAPSYALKILTTAPGLQVYSGAGLPEIPSGKTVSGPVAPLSGIAIEPQLWPDAPDHSAFPSILLDQGQIWKQSTEYRLDC